MGVSVIFTLRHSGKGPGEQVPLGKIDVVLEEFVLDLFALYKFSDDAGAALIQLVPGCDQLHQACGSFVLAAFPDNGSVNLQEISRDADHVQEV